MTVRKEVVNEINRERTIHHMEEVMGTSVILDIYLAEGFEREHIDLCRDNALALLHRADDIFSTWNVDSPMSRLRSGQITIDEAPPEIADVLAKCAVARRLSGGWFDPWAMPGGVDPTGYVKGWAAQRSLDALSGPGICGAVINAAGDIATAGSQVDGKPFRMGIVNPQRPRELATVVEVDGAIATSGTYERGKHLVDPHTRKYCSRAASVTVVGPDLGLADALATALTVAGTDGLELIEALRNYEGFIIDKNNLWHHTVEFPFALGYSRPTRHPI